VAHDVQSNWRQVLEAIHHHLDQVVVALNLAENDGKHHERVAVRDLGQAPVRLDPDWIGLDEDRFGLDEFFGLKIVLH